MTLTKEDSAAASDKPRVVIVDDDAIVLKSLRAVLRHSYTVIDCNNGPDGVLAVKANHPAAIILDLRMPKHDGFWTLREIRKIDNDVPVIINSAYHDSNQQTQASLLQLRPYRVLSKSMEFKDFLQVVKEAVSLRRAT